MKKLLLLIAVAGTFAACDQNTRNDQSLVNRDSYMDLNGKMMAQHALMIEREDALQAQQQQALLNQRSNAAAANTRPARRSTRSNTTYTTTSSSERSDAGIIQAPARKKGWSNAAKGAVIGGVTGAVTGAVISKDKSKGAIIGGVIGAGGGYVIGRSKDKKEGRY